MRGVTIEYYRLVWLLLPQTQFYWSMVPLSVLASSFLAQPIMPVTAVHTTHMCTMGHFTEHINHLKCFNTEGFNSKNVLSYIKLYKLHSILKSDFGQGPVLLSLLWKKKASSMPPKWTMFCLKK